MLLSSMSASAPLLASRLVAASLILAATGPTQAAEAPHGQCNLPRMAATCQQHKPPALETSGTRASYCGNVCVKQMVMCADDMRLGALLGNPRRVGTFKEMAKLCDSKRGRSSRPGDGKCSILDIAAYHKQLDQLHRTPSCNSAMTRELFDCVDDPFLKGQRQEIVRMMDSCSTGPPNLPGDGRCSIMSIAKYQSAGDVVSCQPGRGCDAKRDCRSRTVQEMIDCIDDPLMASQRTGIMRFKRRCGSYRHANGGDGGH